MGFQRGHLVRMWTGWIRTADRDAFAEYMSATTLRDIRATPGNMHVVMLMRDLGDDRTEVTTMSTWRNREAIQDFNGTDDASKPRFYPQDERFLIDRDQEVRLYDVAG